MALKVVRTEEKSGAHLVHWLSDGRWILEDRHSKGSGGHGRWSLWQPRVMNPRSGKIVQSASSLAKLLKWAAKNPPG